MERGPQHASVAACREMMYNFCIVCLYVLTVFAVGCGRVCWVGVAWGGIGADGMRGVVVFLFHEKAICARKRSYVVTLLVLLPFLAEDTHVSIFERGPTGTITCTTKNKNLWKPIEHIGCN